MSTVIIYVAPSSGDLHHPQSRIYRAEFDGFVNTDGIRTHYRNHPERYAEVGLVNFDGKLACFEGTEEQRQELLDSQPIAAGYVFSYTEEQAS
jgi:hypothetical protein